MQHDFIQRAVKGVYNARAHLCVMCVCVCAHRAPPQSVGVGGEVLVEFFLHQIDQEGGEDQHQEADVPGSHQLLEGGGQFQNKSHVLDTFCSVFFAAVINKNMHS